MQLLLALFGVTIRFFLGLKLPLNIPLLGSFEATSLIKYTRLIPIIAKKDDEIDEDRSETLFNSKLINIY